MAEHLPSQEWNIWKLLPYEIAVSTNLDCKKYFQLIFGGNIEVHDDLDTYNMMEPHTYEAVTMGPTVKLNGILKFFCFNNGIILKCHKWTEYLMPQHVAKKIYKRERGIKKIEYVTHLEFRNRNKEIF